MATAIDIAVMNGEPSIDFTPPDSVVPVPSDSRPACGGECATYSHCPPSPVSLTTPVAPGLMKAKAKSKPVPRPSNHSVIGGGSSPVARQAVSTPIVELQASTCIAEFPFEPSVPIADSASDPNEQLAPQCGDYADPEVDGQSVSL